VFGFVDMTSFQLQYILTRSPDTCHRRSDQSASQIGIKNDVRICVVPVFLSFADLGAETGAKTSARALDQDYVSELAFSEKRSRD
jgi:hypothetical protein